MNGITRAKRLKIAQYYVLGYSYGEIVEKAGISHGSATVPHRIPLSITVV